MREYLNMAHQHLRNYFLLGHTGGKRDEVNAALSIISEAIRALETPARPKVCPICGHDEADEIGNFWYFYCRDCGEEYKQDKDAPEVCTKCGSVEVEPQDLG